MIIGRKNFEYQTLIDIVNSSLRSLGISLLEMANGQPPCRFNGLRALILIGTEGLKILSHVYISLYEYNDLNIHIHTYIYIYISMSYYF